MTLSGVGWCALDLDHLRALVAVIEANSITKAARTLHVTQPALSLRLKALEQEIGAPLLERNHTGVTPTVQGHVVFDNARRILDICSLMVEQVRACDGPPELQVGATPTLGGYVLPHVMGRFMGVHPEVKVNLTVTRLTGVVQQVEDGQLLMGFVEDPVEHGGLETVELGDDELRLVTSASWQPPEELDERTAFKLPAVLCFPQCGMRQVLERYLLSRGRSTADMTVVAEMDSLDALKALVEGGAGVAWLSTRPVRREVQAGTLKLWPVKGVRIPYKYVALYRGDRELWSMGKDYLELVRERLRPHRRRGEKG